MADRNYWAMLPWELFLLIDEYLTFRLDWNRFLLRTPYFWNAWFHRQGDNPHILYYPPASDNTCSLSGPPVRRSKRLQQQRRSSRLPLPFLKVLAARQTSAFTQRQAPLPHPYRANKALSAWIKLPTKLSIDKRIKNTDSRGRLDPRYDANECDDPDTPSSSIDVAFAYSLDTSAGIEDPNSSTLISDLIIHRRMSKNPDNTCETAVYADGTALMNTKPILCPRCLSDSDVRYWQGNRVRCCVRCAFELRLLDLVARLVKVRTVVYAQLRQGEVGTLNNVIADVAARFEFSPVVIAFWLQHPRVRIPCRHQFLPSLVVSVPSLDSDDNDKLSNIQMIPSVSFLDWIARKIRLFRDTDGRYIMPRSAGQKQKRSDGKPGRSKRARLLAIE